MADSSLGFSPSGKSCASLFKTAQGKLTGRKTGAKSKKATAAGDASPVRPFRVDDEEASPPAAAEPEAAEMELPHVAGLGPPPPLVPE